MKYRAYKYRLFPNEEQKVLIAIRIGIEKMDIKYVLPNGFSKTLETTTNR